MCILTAFHGDIWACCLGEDIVVNCICQDIVVSSYVYLPFVVDKGPQKATSDSVTKESPDLEDL